MESYQELSREEYLAFLLLYAAYADLELNRIETEEILDCIDKDIFRDTRRYFLSLNDKARLDVILGQKETYLGNKAQVDAALAGIKELFLCDREMLPIEQFYYNFLEREFNS